MTMFCSVVCAERGATLDVVLMYKNKLCKLYRDFSISHNNGYHNSVLKFFLSNTSFGALLALCKITL